MGNREGTSGYGTELEMHPKNETVKHTDDNEIQNSDSYTLWVKQSWLFSQAFWFIFVLSKGEL